MGNVEIEGYAGDRIRTFGDWEKYAMPPERKDRHWKEGRSAFELGRCWTASGEPTIPEELTKLLNSHNATAGAVIFSGITEHETALPFGNRGPRCHDLSLTAKQGGRSMTICIEAKADETFGGTVAEELQKARNRTPRTRFPDRLNWLTCSLLGIPAFEDEERIVLSPVIAQLPYQLFAAIAGTLIEEEIRAEAEARATWKAVLVVHEFRTHRTDDTKMRSNGEALDEFLRLVLENSGAAKAGFRLRHGNLVGPLPLLERQAIEGRRMPCHIPLFVGKIRTDLIGPS
ncbi:MAG: hypothetical protein JST93_26075 [Acidobacteria bacterium]|nr:hypothetical protein [Acidobacteriota bacterium]